MRALRYSVAASLDGYIAGPNGEFDWIVPILLGGGIPLLPAPGPRLRLQLRSRVLYSQTGTMILSYGVVRE